MHAISKTLNAKDPYYKEFKVVIIIHLLERGGQRPGEGVSNLERGTFYDIVKIAIMIILLRGHSLICINKKNIRI